MAASLLNTRRIVMLGKTGAGTSSLANTIFGENMFKTGQTVNSETNECLAVTKSVNGRSITLCDTPGFFNTVESGEVLKAEIGRCITECSPGPHAFFIVLKLEEFTEHVMDVIALIQEYFSTDAFKYAAVVFTHGDQLTEGMEIEKYVEQSQGLSNLVKRCGGRYHIVDNKYWKTNDEDDYRSNRYQVAKLLDTVDKIVKENNQGYYTNEKLQEVEREIQGEEERLRRSSGNMSQRDIRKQAVGNVLKKRERTWMRLLVRFAVIAGFIATMSAVWKVFKAKWNPFE